MITVLIWQKIINKKPVFTKIVVKGHSFKEANVTDALCAAVSAVVLGTVNTLIELKLIKNNLVLEQNNGYLSFTDLKPDANKQLILYQMIVQLQTIKKYFQQGIKIVNQKTNND